MISTSLSSDGEFMTYIYPLAPVTRILKDAIFPNPEGIRGRLWDNWKTVLVRVLGSIVVPLSVQDIYFLSFLFVLQQLISPLGIL